MRVSGVSWNIPIHQFETNMFEALSFTYRFSSLAQAERYDRKWKDWHVTRIVLSRLLLDIDGVTLRWWCNEFILGSSVWLST